jgi:hypothetical protein
MRMNADRKDEAQSERSPFDVSYYGHEKNGPDGKIAYLNIYRHPKSTYLSLPGKDFVELKFRQATSVEIAEEKSGNLPERLYWAWLENGADHFIMIQPHESLFEICFAHGSSAEVNAGKGKIYRLAVEKTNPISLLQS